MKGTNLPPERRAGAAPAPSAAAPSPHGANIHKLSDNDNDNLLYEGESFHSGSEVSVESVDSSIPVTILDEDALVDFCD